MRWILLLLIPAITSAESLTGIWSAATEDDPPGRHRVVIVDAYDRIYFHYENHGWHMCEVFGIANRRSPASADVYVFRNDREHHLYEGYEGYGSVENEDCEVSFEHDGAILKVRSMGNCRSFCGVNASIGGDLHKVPDENLTIRASERP